jgi:hypothetical protein
VPTSPNRPGPASALRFLTELVAWIATPWALWSVSRPLAIVAVIILIGLPTVFATPGDKRQVIVPVAGHVTVALVVLQMVAAVVSSWFAWHPAIAACVSVLVAVSVVTEWPRWSWLVSVGSGDRTQEV